MGGCANKNIAVYTAVGRIMDGNKLIGCSLLDINGNTRNAVKADVIGMAAQGLIDNLRTVCNEEGKYILRGKGVNLLTLPTVNVRFKESENKMVALSGTLFRGTKVIGYIVMNSAGKKYPIKKSEYSKMLKQDLIINCGDKRENLDYYKLDCNNSIVKVNKALVRVRATIMCSGGILYDEVGHKKRIFQKGDVIFCNPDGTLSIVPDSERQSRFSIDLQHCFDHEIKFNSKRYSVEPFGKMRMDITEELIMKWSLTAFVRG